MSSSTINSVIDDTATLGKITTSISFIISIIIGIILIICAIVIGNKQQKPFINAEILSAKCDSYNKIINNRNEIRYSCILKLKYTINNIEYLRDISTESNRFYNPNTFIEIEYDEKNPNLASIKGLDNSTQSYISIGIAVLIIGIAWLNFYLTNKSKAYASIQGFSTLGSAVRIGY